MLDQERPNIFTQSVANITPNAEIKVVIQYVETLKYQDDAYEFSFPMTIGERYIPLSVDEADAARISPKSKDRPDKKKFKGKPRDKDKAPRDERERVYSANAQAKPEDNPFAALLQLKTGK